MVKVSKTWLPAVMAAGVLTLIFALLALVLYTRTERGVVEKHSQDQRVLAALAGTALAQRVDDHHHRAEAAADILHGLPEEDWEGALARLTPAAPEGNVFLLWADGRMHFRVPPRHPSELELAARRWQGVPRPVLTNPFPTKAEQREVALLLPLPPDDQPRAQVGFTLPFEFLVETVLPGKPTSTPFNLTLLDEEGLVLANGRHPEMIGRRIPEPGKTCQPCHTSFALERRMVAGESGVSTLQVAEQPLALVAYSPVEMLGRRWAVALSEPHTAIIADTRRGFRGITFLLGLSLVVGIGATTLTLQYRDQRRRAEERARQAERRAALERQLRQNEQLASIGKMTSQIAHQINTPLATLGLNVAYLRTEVARRLGAASPQAEEVSEAITEEIDRLKHVVNDYLRFSRLPQPVLERQSLRETVESCLDFVEAEARGNGVRLETDLGLEAAETLLDADLFRQAFLNLVRNSFEAMPEGGRLRVSLRVVDGEALLRVEDTGRGIPAEALPHVFDPFFTTKKEGTGLGLAHVRRVIEEHGGAIECTSEVGQGTAFVVRLPAHAPESQNAKELLAS